MQRVTIVKQLVLHDFVHITRMVGDKIIKANGQVFGFKIPVVVCNTVIHILPVLWLLGGLSNWLINRFEDYRVYDP